MRQENPNGRNSRMPGENATGRSLAFWLVIYATLVIAFGAVAGTTFQADATPHADAAPDATSWQTAPGEPYDS